MKSQHIRNVRLQKELAIIHKSELKDINIIADDIAEWRVFLKGSNGTPYEGGIFEVKCIFPMNYPFDAPKVVFLTNIIHPNINDGGDICLDIFQSWSASITMQRVILAILTLLETPNPDDPLVPHIANIYKTNYEKYVEMAKKYTKKYAVKL